MTESQKVYTYRAGQKVELKKSTDQLVVRALPDRLDDPETIDSEQVSSASTRITTSSEELEAMMSRSRLIAPTHHAYYESETGADFLITDWIFVTFKDELSDQQVDEFAGRYGLVKKAVYGKRDYLFQLTNHTGRNPIKLVVKLTEEEPLVEAAENDLNQRVQTSFPIPSDPEYRRQWHLHTDFNNPEFDTRSCTFCEDAWDLLDNYGSEEVVVAITDDGCKLDHHDFDSPGKFTGWGYLRGERLITSKDIDADPAEMYKPGSNHGTSCAGVIAGEADAVLNVGAALGCRLFPIQWESSGPSLFISDSKMLTVLEYIKDKVDVMSNSWSGVPLNLWASQVVNRITELARTGGKRGKGIVFLWAAGNDNYPINYTATQDVPYDDGVAVQGGALVWVGVKTTRIFRRNLVGIPGLRNIAALASTARQSHYSNYSPGISLCAPTNNGHTYHRMSVEGLGITTTTGASDGITHQFGGTSSAIPLVAGIAALTISANPYLTALEVVSILKQTASKDLDFQGYSRTPPASFDPDISWDVSPIAPFDSGEFSDTGEEDGTWSPWFGHGRVDAKAAVGEALKGSGRPGELTFQGSSSPNKSIPDKDSLGIKDNMGCDKTFTIRSIKVKIDITHTFIGDLLVTLISPSGTSVVLHNRSGGSINNLHREFDVGSVPELNFLSNEQVEGIWTLHVQDLAAEDKGSLKSWSLEISGQAEATFDVEESPGMIIPDDITAGIERSLNVSQSGQLGGIQVDIDITHTYVGDLLVELVSPSNTSVLLHNRTGGSTDNIIKTYTEINTPNLQALLGETVECIWKLKGSDRAGADQGKLNRWALKLMKAAYIQRKKYDNIS